MENKGNVSGDDRSRLQDLSVKIMKDIREYMDILADSYANAFEKKDISISASFVSFRRRTSYLLSFDISWEFRV